MGLDSTFLWGNREENTKRVDCKIVLAHKLGEGNIGAYMRHEGYKIVLARKNVGSIDQGNIFLLGHKLGERKKRGNTVWNLLLYYNRHQYQIFQDFPSHYLCKPWYTSQNILGFMLHNMRLFLICA